MANRSIFEDVSGDKPQEALPKGGMIDAPRRGARRMVARWLGVLWLLVALMIVVGGLTRLTDSGLSITEWRPVTGAMPPMNADAWQAEFDKYREIPEYQLQNKGMSLSEFKFIYWWEWGHRQLGRFVGLVWAMGFVFFLATKRIPTGWTGRLFAVGVLGGIQGAIGWWMVSSGLTGRMLDVASYRLAIHLGMAFVILCVLAYFMWLLWRDEKDLMQARRQRDRKMAGMTHGLLTLIFVQILLGALVAGIDAGRSFVDWPLMGGQFFPETGWDLSPAWSNFFENAGLVQFNHRILGYVVFAATLAFWWISRGSAHAAVKRQFDWVAVAVFGQMVLGIVTVLTVAPLHWAILHQIGAIAVMMVTLRALFVATYPPVSTLR